MKPVFQKILAVLTFGALLLGLIGLASIWHIHRLVAGMGVQSLDYRIEKFDIYSVQFSRLSFQYSTASVSQQVNAEALRIQWTWLSAFTPQLSSVDVARLYWQIKHDDETPPTSLTSPFTLPEDWSIPDFLPASIHIHNAHLTLPCPTGECYLAGALDLQNAEDTLRLHGKFSPGRMLHSQQVDIKADYQLNRQLPALNLHIAAGDAVHAQLQMQLIREEELAWSGQLTAHARYPETWLLAALAEWQIRLDNQWAQTVNQPMAVSAKWQWDVAPLLQRGTQPWHKLLQGYAELDADIASPIAVENIGKFSGDAVVRIKAENGALETYDVSADVTVTEPVLPAAWRSRGIAVERLDIHAESQSDAVSVTDLPIQLAIRTEGKLRTDITLHASIDAVEKALHVADVKLDAQLAQLQATPDLQFNHLDVLWRGAAEWRGNQFILRAQAPTRVHGDLQAGAWSLAARTAKLALDNLTISGKLVDGNIDWSELHIDTTALLSIAQLQHPQLHTRPWQWQGHGQGNREKLAVKGELVLNNALVISHQVKADLKEMRVDWQLHDSFLLAGNPFADLARAWPPLLSLSQGKVNGEGQVTVDLNQQTLKNGLATVVVNDISGVYDTTLFQGLTATLSATAKPKTFILATDELHIKHIIKGFVFGPLKAAGIYEAGWENPAEGELALQDFYVDAIGGNVTTPAQVFDLSKDKQSLALTLENIDLGLLLQQHPSTELSGSGRISGTVPIEITANGVSVPKGSLAARPPGGQLQLHSERAEALAKSQPSMKLITDALEDFHYTVLASEVSYDEDGKLLLGLRLEGRNPALENGRPVHFNINLEEDLPAMIASIQLSNQITDVVKKRLQEHLQKRSAR